MSESVLIDTQLLVFARQSIEAGIENTRETLADRDNKYGRKSPRNKQWAAELESQLIIMEESLVGIGKVLGNKQMTTIIAGVTAKAN